MFEKVFGVYSVSMIFAPGPDWMPENGIPDSKNEALKN